MGILDSSGLASTPDTSVTVTPSSDLQPYVKNVLDKGNALLNAPTPAYTGQLTAGPSQYQTEAWKGLAGLSLPSDMTTAGTALGNISTKAQELKFDPTQVQSYMNPYLDLALKPQLEEMRRQSQVNLQPYMAKLTQAGGFGGGRQAIMQSEANRNLLQEQDKLTGQGYKDAYDSAMKAAQYAADFGLKGLQQATAASQAQGNIGAQEAQYGLANLQALATAGNKQQEQEQAALNAKYNEWLRQQKYLPDMLTKQQSLIQGMPGGTTTNTYKAKPSVVQQLVGTSAGISNLVKNLKDSGLTQDKIDSFLKSVGINVNNPGQVDTSGWTDNKDGTYTTTTGQTLDKDGNPVERNADGTYTDMNGITRNPDGSVVVTGDTTQPDFDNVDGAPNDNVTDDQTDRVVNDDSATWDV